jgi:hypothetical protein
MHNYYSDKIMPNTESDTFYMLKQVLFLRMCLEKLAQRLVTLSLGSIRSCACTSWGFGELLNQAQAAANALRGQMCCSHWLNHS